MLRYIYAPPPAAPPRSGDAKYILPIMEDAVVLARMRMSKQSLMGGVGVGGLYLEHVRYETGTVTPRGK